MPHASRLHMPLAAASALCVALAFAGPLSGQESTTRGFNLGVHLQGASLSVEDGDPDGGGGGGIRFGYGFNRIVTGFLEIDGVSVDVMNDDLEGKWNLGHVDLGARFHFANALRSWVPFLEAAVGVRAVSVNDALVNNQDVEDVSFSGGSFSVGGGIMIYFKRSLALDVSAKGTVGEFNQIDVGAISVSGLDINATSGRFKVGIVWWR